MLQPYFNGKATKQVFVLTDEHTEQVCLPLLGDTVKGAPRCVVPSGEAAKTIDNVQRIWDFLLAHHATRQAVLVNIGGGVVTDMGGFAAATYKRGIRFVNVPTTFPLRCLRWWTLPRAARPVWTMGVSRTLSAHSLCRSRH